jgi:DNA-binding winged helix-turn-helix (wHTH) protein/TolB-like protein/Flp pilus assembly protein TadD
MDEISNIRIYRFGDFTLDLDRAALSRGPDEIRLRPRTFDVLVYLVRNAGRLISKQELFDAVWRDVAVTDDSLVQCLVEIRRALNGSHDVVKTIRGRGYLFDAVVRAGQPAMPGEDAAAVTPASEPRRRAWRMPALVLIAVAVFAGAAWLLANRSPAGATLAVLPLRHAETADAAVRAEGLHEDVVAALGQIDPARLRVLSRRSTLGYRGTAKSAAEIGGELGADYLVDGAVRDEDDVLRLTFTVVRTRDQVQVWSGTFDHDRASLPQLQTELGRTVAQQIRMTLSPERDQALVRRQARNPAAYEHYLRGRALWARTNRAALFAAIEAFSQATALDPDYALAHAGLADTYSALPITSDVPPLDVAGRARDAAAAAVRADPLLAEAHAAVGWQEFWFGWDWPAAEASLRRATVLDPNYANAHRWLGHVLSNAGRHSEALAEMARARELDPSSPLLHVLSAQAAYHAHDFGAAERHARQAIAIDRNIWAGHLALAQALAASGNLDAALLEAGEAHRLSGNAKSLTRRGYVLGRMGRHTDARDVLREAERLARESFVPPYEISVVHAGLGDADGLFAALERAYAVRDANLVFLPVDPKMDPFRDDPRFRALLDRCGFRSVRR